MASAIPLATLAAVLLVLAALVAPGLSFSASAMFGSVKMVGGQEVDISKAKTLVQIEHKQTNGKWLFKCTGFIGKNDVIVTAASCAGDSKTHKALPKNTLRVRAGSATSLSGGQTRPVGNVVVHPKWRTSTPKTAPEVLMNTFDVAVLVLKAPLALSENVKVAKLARIGNPPAAEAKLLAAGLALASATDETRLTLRRVVVRAIPNNNCTVLINNLGGKLTSDQFCVRNGIGKAFCTTDAGAPATLSDDGTVVGIFSWAWSTCGFDSVPGVLTDMTNRVVRQFVDKYLAAKQVGK